MKKTSLFTLLVGAAFLTMTSCEKEQPAKNVEGDYVGVLEGIYDGDVILEASHQVRVTSSTKNKVNVEGNLFATFEVLVTQQGVNVDPVSTDDEVAAFLYQGDLRELSFTYYHAGDTAVFIGTKPE